MDVLPFFSLVPKGPPVNITQGTIETILVDVTDRTGQVLSLTGLAPRFDVKDESGAYMMQNVAATNAGMIAQCLINTNVPSLWPVNTYFLYLRFTASPETPVLGPLPFTVNP